jgi:hypothetical protein
MLDKNSTMMLAVATGVVLIISTVLLKSKKPEYVLDEKKEDVSNAKLVMYSLLFALLFGLLAFGAMVAMNKNKLQFGMGKSCSSCVDTNMKKYIF